MRDLEEQFKRLRHRAALAQLSREEISELIGITANLLEERKRIHTLLARLPASFGQVRQLLNDLSRLAGPPPAGSDTAAAPD